MKARIQLVKSVNADNSAIVMFGKTIYPSDEIPVTEARNNLSAHIYVATSVTRPTTDKHYLIFNQKTHTFEVNKLGTITYDNFNSVDRYRYTNLDGVEIELSDIEEIIATTDDLPGIPKIHRCFVNAYIRNYNTDAFIEDVWVVEDENGTPVVLSNNTIVIKKYIKPEDEQPTLAVNGESFFLAEIQPEPVNQKSQEEPLDTESEIKRKEEKTQQGIQKLLQEIFENKSPKEILMEELIKKHQELMETLELYYQKQNTGEEPIITNFSISGVDTSRPTMTIQLLIPDNMTEEEFLETDMVQNILDQFES